MSADAHRQHDHGHSHARGRAHREHAHPRTADMLSVEEALDRVLRLVERLPVERVPLLDADGLTLGEDVRSPFDVPSLANSAMDGYAVRAADARGASEASPVTLKIVGQVQAGQLPGAAVREGTCVRIMTGAPLPDGADAVIPYEFTDETERRAAGLALDYVALRHAPSEGDHARPAGEDAAAGELILRSGRPLDPPALGLLASFGFADAPVHRRPRVAVLATGDEVQTPGEAPEPGRLFDSNSYGAAAALRRWGAEPVLLGVARDNMDDLRAKIRRGLDSDLLITSAGVSAGAFDMVKEALGELGSMDFWAVRMRPARPIAFGLLNAPDGGKVSAPRAAGQPRERARRPDGVRKADAGEDDGARARPAPHGRGDAGRRHRERGRAARLRPRHTGAEGRRPIRPARRRGRAPTCSPRWGWRKGSPFARRTSPSGGRGSAPSCNCWTGSITPLCSRSGSTLRSEQQRAARLTQ